MEEDLRNRFKEVLSYYNSNLNQLSKGDKAMQVRLSRQINQGATVTYEIISLLLESYPAISSEWLLRGKGEMLTASSDNTTKEVAIDSDFQNLLLDFMLSANKKLINIDKNTTSVVNQLKDIKGLKYTG